MKNLLLVLLTILFIAPFVSNNAQADPDTNKIRYSWWLEYIVNTPIGDIKFNFEAFNDSISEGQEFEVVPATMDNDFAKFQDLYDALVGTQFKFPFGALENDIELEIYMRQLDTTTGTYNTVGVNNDTMFAYFEIQVIEDTGDGVIVYDPDEDFYFANDLAITFKIPFTTKFESFLTALGFDLQEELIFAYLKGDNTFSDDGIVTQRLTGGTLDSLLIEAQHFSKFGGGRGILVPVEHETSLNLIPEEYVLSQNYPNPFNPTTKITYSIPEEGYVNLTVYNVLGKQVETLVSENKTAGTYEVTFDASKLSSGVYFYKLNSGRNVITKKMLLVK